MLRIFIKLYIYTCIKHHLAYKAILESLFYLTERRNDNENKTHNNENSRRSEVVEVYREEVNKTHNNETRQTTTKTRQTTTNKAKKRKKNNNKTKASHVMNML